jgi:putative hydrolase of the HAD superfamily
MELGDDTVWLFDYDLTLYPWEEKGVLDSLDRHITRYVAEVFGIPGSEADLIRQRYWKLYGTTLEGLEREKGIDPHHYFDTIHGGADVVRPRQNPALRNLLLRLPGERHLFTNARRDWAEMGLDALGIRDCIGTIVDLEDAGWRGKPGKPAYEAVERLLGPLAGRSVVLLDDKSENLEPAARRGWRTVHVHGPHAPWKGADLGLERLLELGNCLQIGDNAT